MSVFTGEIEASSLSYLRLLGYFSRLRSRVSSGEIFLAVYLLL